MRSGHFLFRTTSQHSCRHKSVSSFFAELHGGKFEHILNMPPRSLLFSFTVSASWARTSFSSSTSWVFRVSTMAQAARAPPRQADIYHNRIRHRAPLNSSRSTAILPRGRRMAIKPWQHSALLAELARAFGKALVAGRLEIRTFPLRDGQLAYLQT